MSLEGARDHSPASSVEYSAHGPGAIHSISRDGPTAIPTATNLAERNVVNESANGTTCQSPTKHPSPQVTEQLQG